MKKIVACLVLCIPLVTLADNCNQAPGYFENGVHKKSSCDPIDLKNSCGNRYGKTFFSFRPQDSNTARRIISMPFERTRSSNEDDSFITITGEFQNSFKSHNLAQWFFFNGCECMNVGISNSRVINDLDGNPLEVVAFDVDGGQLGLSLGNTRVSNPPATPFDVLTPGPIGSICADPLVRNFILDINAQFDLCEVAQGLWFQLDFPVVWTQTNMRFTTTGRGSDAQDFPGGLFSLPPSDVDDDFLCSTTPVVYTDILDAFCGSKEFGAVETLKSGKFAPCALSTTRLAGVHADLGYDFCVTDKDYIAAAVHVVGPTGTRPNSEFIFEPVAGANKSWQLGVLFSGYHMLDTCGDDVGIYWYAVGTHLFKARQARIFNLTANGPGSQYLLVKEIDAAQVGAIDSIERLANAFTGEVRIGANLMFDGSVMLAWERERVALSIGYNFWARTQEKRDSHVTFRNYHFINSSYGIKGNEPASVFTVGFDECSESPNTASTSTIRQAGPEDPEDDQPVLIKIDDINYNVPLHPATWSNKIFGTFTYKGSACCQDAFVSFGAAVEFGHKNSSLNFVGGYIQTGIAY